LYDKLLPYYEGMMETKLCWKCH